MEAQLRQIIGDEFRRRHGIGVMTGKIKPVHIANALMRVEHNMVGKMGDLEQLMTATAMGKTSEQRMDAVRAMIERNRERWGRLGQDGDLKKSVLVTRVLPLLRTILATDNAAYGASPDFSSFSSPSALTVTRDPSDEHAGELIHWLWGARDPARRLRILDLFARLTDPSRDVGDIDDLSAVLIPLSDSMSPLRNSTPFHPTYDSESQVMGSLRAAAVDLAKYEEALRPNPIASLQRIVLLASMTLFFHSATRGHENGETPNRLLLLDASNQRQSSVAVASEDTVSTLLADGKRYMSLILRDLLHAAYCNWPTDSELTLSTLLREKSNKSTPSDFRQLHEILEELLEAGADVAAELPDRLVSMLDGSNGQGLDGYLRLLGVRCGLLYPQQKNPRKRLLPMDRTLEILVAGTFDVSGQPLEYRDFLDALYERWRIVVGGRLEDAKLLADAGSPVPSADLSANSRRFLVRLESLGLARELADSVAVVGLMENSHVVA